MVTLSGTAASNSPILLWTGVKRVNLLCNVVGGPGIDYIALRDRLCRDLTRLASKGAPMPVVTIALGDPAVLASDAVTLVVHASVTLHRQDRLLAFSVRPYRASSEQTAVLFGAAPRAAPLFPSGVNPVLDTALAAALSETLPWLAKSQAPQRIRLSN